MATSTNRTSNDETKYINIMRRRECPVCFMTLTQRIFQCYNGHLICEECLGKNLRLCPVCREKYPKKKIRAREYEEILRDYFTTDCRYKGFGCQLNLHFEEIAEHEASCEFKEERMYPDLSDDVDENSSPLTGIESYVLGTWIEIHQVSSLCDVESASIKFSTHFLQFACPDQVVQKLYIKTVVRGDGRFVRWAVTLEGQPELAQDLGLTAVIKLQSLIPTEATLHTKWSGRVLSDKELCFREEKADLFLTVPFDLLKFYCSQNRREEYHNGQGAWRLRIKILNKDDQDVSNHSVSSKLNSLQVLRSTVRAIQTPKIFPSEPIAGPSSASTAPAIKRPRLSNNNNIFDWHTPLFRHSMVNKIEEAITESVGARPPGSSLELEIAVFNKARTREEYLSYIARLIIHIKDHRRSAGQRESPSSSNVNMNGQSEPDTTISEIIGRTTQQIQDTTNSVFGLMNQIGTRNVTVRSSTFTGPSHSRHAGPLQVNSTPPVDPPAPSVQSTPVPDNPITWPIRQKIWAGTLEWHESQRGPEVVAQRMLREIPCQISTKSVVGGPDITSDGWPQKLVMQLIPKAILGSVGGNYFKNVNTVLFTLLPCDSLGSLTRMMDSGFAGCVHFTRTQVNCNIKVLILLYSKERNAFLGFIPHDQAGFVDRMRNIIQHQKNLHSATRQGASGVAQVAPAPSNTFTIPWSHQGPSSTSGSGSRSNTRQDNINEIRQPLDGQS